MVTRREFHDPIEQQEGVPVREYRFDLRSIQQSTTCQGGQVMPRLKGARRLQGASIVQDESALFKETPPPKEIAVL